MMTALIVVGAVIVVAALIAVLGNIGEAEPETKRLIRLAERDLAKRPRKR